MDSVTSEQTCAAPASVTTQARVDDDGISCGGFLRRAREERGLTLEHIAQATKIPLWHLNALERDQFGALPGGLYRRAEVRAYADAVGLERSVALARLDRALELALPPPATNAQAPVAPSMLARLVGPLLMIAGAALTTGVIALATWPSQSGARDITPIRRAGPPPNRTIEPSTETHAQPEIERSVRALAASTVEFQLTVITEPLGARVTVNGVGRGITPVTIRHLTPGPKSVRVTLEGYVTEEQVIHLEPDGGVTTVRIPLRTHGNERESVSINLPENDGARN